MSRQSDRVYGKEQSESQCPECGNRYQSSGSQSGSGTSSQSQERIMIPIRKQLFQQDGNNQIQQVIRNLQKQIEGLKLSNTQKDRVIEDMKKQMEHKMTHYMFYGELNKHTDQINRLKSQLNRSQNNIRSGSLRQPNLQLNNSDIRQLIRDQSKKINQQFSLKGNFSPKEFKKHSQHKPIRTKQQFQYGSDYFLPPSGSIPSFKQKSRRNTSPDIFDGFNGNFVAKSQHILQKQYFPLKTQKSKSIFKIGDAKKKIAQLEHKIKIYQQQMLWLTNFANTFIKAMQKIAFKKHRQQIVIPEWNLKKKVKTCWKYLKHLLTYLYSNQYQS